MTDEATASVWNPTRLPEIAIPQTWTPSDTRPPRLARLSPHARAILGPGPALCELPHGPNETTRAFRALCALVSPIPLELPHAAGYYGIDTDSVYMRVTLSWAAEAVLAHEVVHWTGAAHRLCRWVCGPLSPKAKALEELTAEIGLLKLLTRLGADPTRHYAHTRHRVHNCYGTSVREVALRADADSDDAVDYIMRCIGGGRE